MCGDTGKNDLNDYSKAVLLRLNDCPCGICWNRMTLGFRVVEWLSD